MSIRFIYAYRDKTTGLPVYVGSANDPVNRDKEHCNRPEVPFDKELRKRGERGLRYQEVQHEPFR